jgi:hypothetical protein
MKIVPACEVWKFRRLRVLPPPKNSTIFFVATVDKGATTPPPGPVNKSLLQPFKNIPPEQFSLSEGSF